MTTPQRTVAVGEASFTAVLPGTQDDRFEAILPKLGIPKGDNRHFTGAFWVGDHFDALLCYVRGANDYFSPARVEVSIAIDDFGPHHAYSLEAVEFRTLFHYPLDPQITAEDIKGAKTAYANADNTGWLFSHTDASYHYDRELELRSAIVAVFQPQIDTLLASAISASTSQRALANRVQWDRLVRFRDKVVECGTNRIKKMHLGWFQQNPDKSHLFSMVRSCIAEIAFKGLSTSDPDYTAVTAEVNAIRNTLNTFSIETRWEQAARIEAEKKAAAAAAESETS